MSKERSKDPDASEDPEATGPYHDEHGYSLMDWQRLPWRKWEGPSLENQGTEIPKELWPEYSRALRERRPYDLGAAIERLRANAGKKNDKP